MGAVAKTFPISSPFARAVNRLEWKNLWIIAALVLAAVASVFRDGVVEKFVSNSTLKSFNTREVDMRLDPTLIWNFFELEVESCHCSGQGRHHDSRRSFKQRVSQDPPATNPCSLSGHTVYCHPRRS